MNYFFLAAAFFAFHLLLAYLVDHMEMNAAFAIAAAASVFLVVSYLRIVAGMRTALVQAGSPSSCSSCSSAMRSSSRATPGSRSRSGGPHAVRLMQLTARVDWAAVFAKR